MGLLAPSVFIKDRLLHCTILDSVGGLHVIGKNFQIFMKQFKSKETDNDRMPLFVTYINNRSMRKY